MKRLFCIRNVINNSLLKLEEGIFYSNNKTEAKKVRDVHNNNGKARVFCISRGPDHMGKHGNSIARMRLQPKRG